MAKVIVEIINDDGEVDTYNSKLPCNRAAFYNGNVSELPEWVVAKIRPISEKSLDIGEVWCNWQRKESLTIRGKNGYQIASRGSLILDHGDHDYQIIKLE